MTREEKSAGIILYYMDEEEKTPHFILLKYPRYWGFAKGLIEEGETELETAFRETIEETGISGFKIVNGFQHKQKWFFKWEGELVNKEAIFFLAKTTKQEAEKTRISNEHEGFEWLTLEKAIEKMRIGNNIKMLKEAYNFIIDNEKQKKLDL